MGDYTKSYSIGPHTVTFSWGDETKLVVTWSPPLTDEQRCAVESTEAFEWLMGYPDDTTGSLEGYECRMMSFIGEAMAVIHGPGAYELMMSYLDEATVESAEAYKCMMLGFIDVAMAE